MDIDLSKRTLDEIVVEREGSTFKVEEQYERKRKPLFCHHCYVIGHNVANCKWLHLETIKEKDK